MHQISICLLLIGLLLVTLNVHSAPSSTVGKDQRRSCPEEYRELRRRRDDQWKADSDDDDDDDGDEDDEISENQWREQVCEKAKTLIIRHRQKVNIDPVLLQTFCPHYAETMLLARENNDTLCESKKRELKMKKRHYDFDDSDDDDSSSDSDEDDKRRALRRRQLKKRTALRFIRKRMF